MLLIVVVVVVVFLVIGGGVWWLLSLGDVLSVVDLVLLGQMLVDKLQQQILVVDVEQDGGECLLLMLGKKILFQCVLIKFGVVIFVEVGGLFWVGVVLVFLVFYVYVCKQVGGSFWLCVGVFSNGEGDGWLLVSVVSDWKQSLVLKFIECFGCVLVMFFNSVEQVECLFGDICVVCDILIQVVDYKGDLQVVVVEFNDWVIFQDQFYLLLIFDLKESFDVDGQLVQLLEVVLIDFGGSVVVFQVLGQVGQGGVSGVVSDIFCIGIVLVVDILVLMQFYIDCVCEVIDGLQWQIGECGDLDKVSFGLVGFCNNIDKIFGLEYVSKILVLL